VPEDHDDQQPRRDAIIRPDTVRAMASIPQPTIGGDAFTVSKAAASLEITATLTAEAEVVPGPELTTAGIEVEHVRQIRYSSGYKDGMRYVEVVGGNGEYIRSTMGEAADALYDLLLYLLPPDHPDYPKG
jgi:hypothetical protein